MVMSAGSAPGRAARATPRVMNPLWIISLFLGLAEVVAGIVATQVTGWVQGLLALFVVLFPTGVAAAFFLVVWHRPLNLYAPKDFSGAVKPSDFAAAVGSSRQ